MANSLCVVNNLTTHNQDRYRSIKQGDVVAVEHDWVKTFAILPHRTVSKKWVWLRKVYVRRVWVYTGFVDEPDTQYADLFEILSHVEVRN